MRGEDYTQSLVRLSAPAVGETLWRNNVGVLLDVTGRPVRFGLANDSPKINEKIKSGDLIGWKRVLITPAMIGQVIAQFVSRECKHEGWVFTGQGREAAQAEWARLVNVAGGDARFITGRLDGGVKDE